MITRTHTQTTREGDAFSVTFNTGAIVEVEAATGGIIHMNEAAEVQKDELLVAGILSTESGCLILRATTEQTDEGSAFLLAISNGRHVRRSWCKCGQGDDEPYYYERAHGGHGWACRHCDGFVQLG